LSQTKNTVKLIDNFQQKDNKVTEW